MDVAFMWPGLAKREVRRLRVREQEMEGRLKMLSRSAADDAAEVVRVLGDESACDWGIGRVRVRHV